MYYITNSEQLVLTCMSIITLIDCSINNNKISPQIITIQLYDKVRCMHSFLETIPTTVGLIPLETQVVGTYLIGGPLSPCNFIGKYVRTHCTIRIRNRSETWCVDQFMHNSSELPRCVGCKCSTKLDIWFLHHPC